MPARNPIPPGTQFGLLTVVRHAGRDPKTRKSLSECKCKCGAVVVKRDNDLRTGRIVSCGCAKRERARKQMWERAESSNANHMSQTRLYHCWHDMVRRCTDPNRSAAKDYMLKGITVCESWRKSFRVFRRWAETHGYRDDLEIDRIDYKKGYYPSNCRFVDIITQANNRSNNRVIEFNGRRLTVAQWSRELGVPYDKLKKHTRKGGSLADYITV